jgi:hypothetical protein
MKILYNGEFDPGSERTLAARFKHASRTGTPHHFFIAGASGHGRR